MLLDDGADVVVGVETDHDDVIRSDTDGDHGERRRADKARARHRAALLERDRVEHGHAALDGERQDQTGQDQTGRVVGEQVAEVLLEDAEELAGRGRQREVLRTLRPTKSVVRRSVEAAGNLTAQKSAMRHR